MNTHKSLSRKSYVCSSKNIQNGVGKQCNRILMEVVTIGNRFVAGGRSYPLLLIRMNIFKGNEFNMENFHAYIFIKNNFAHIKRNKILFLTGVCVSKLSRQFSGQINYSRE